MAFLVVNLLLQCISGKPNHILEFHFRPALMKKIVAERMRQLLMIALLKTSTEDGKVSDAFSVNLK